MCHTVDVEVSGQPWMVVLIFYLEIRCLNAHSYVLLAGLRGFRDPPLFLPAPAGSPETTNMHCHIHLYVGSVDLNLLPHIDWQALTPEPSP